MASDDANVSPNPAVQDKFVRSCAKCNAEMRRLGVLPALSIRAAIKVYRCFVCGHVVAEPT
jgi:hypothetical protein